MALSKAPWNPRLSALEETVENLSVGGGNGDLLAANNLSDVDDVPTARTNLDVDQAGTDNSPPLTKAAVEGVLTGEISTHTHASVAEVNDLSAAVTWDDIPDTNVPETAVTQHEAALTIIEGQVTGAAFSNWNTAFGWGDHASGGYAADTNVANWDAAFGWGNHATAGYLEDKADVEAVLTGEISTHTHAGGSGGISEYMMPVWAEENAVLGTSAYEWAFGNGANTPIDGGLTIYVPSGWTCEVVAMSLRLGSGTATVELVHNGTVKGSAANVVLSTGQSATNELSTPLAIANNDYINFRTTSSSGTSSPCVICAWLKYTET